MASSSADWRSISTLRISTTTESPWASGSATLRSRSASSGPALMTTSVSPLRIRATWTAVSHASRGPIRGTVLTGVEMSNQMAVELNRPTRASRQRSKSSASLRDSRMAAAKALGRVPSAGRGHGLIHGQ